MLALRLRSWKDWTAVCPCNTRDAPSPLRKRHPIRHSCEPVTDHPHTLPGAVPVLTIRPGLGQGPSPNSRHIAPKEPCLTRLLTTGPQPAKVAAIAPREPTFLQKARWQAIQKAKRKGMSIRGIARELGIHRATVRRYLDADNPPTRQSRIASTTPTSDTIAA